MAVGVLLSLAVYFVASLCFQGYQLPKRAEQHRAMCVCKEFSMLKSEKEVHKYKINKEYLCRCPEPASLLFSTNQNKVF